MVTPAKTDVLVIGAGVSGLTTGICLAESGRNVRLLAKDPPLRTTSAVAGASWGPYLVSDSRVLRWSMVTLDVLERIAASDHGAGVSLVNGMECSDVEIEAPQWARDVAEFRLCEPDELPSGYLTGWRYRIPLVDMPRYLTYLEERLGSAGATCEYGEEVADLSAMDRVAPVVINCTGLGARELVPDPAVTPVRGQVVVVRNPGVEWFFQDQAEGDELTYFLPHGEYVVLGGSAIPGLGASAADPLIRAQIIERCIKIEPRFAAAEVLGDRVGLRPTRSQVRVERDGNVIHNYGHGGSGLTLSWGCAQEVLRAVPG